MEQDRGDKVRVRDAVWAAAPPESPPEWSPGLAPEARHRGDRHVAEAGDVCAWAGGLSAVRPGP